MSKRISKLSLLEAPTGDEYIPVAYEKQNYALKVKDIGTVIKPSQLGLGNVDNTSDANKPVSVATNAALNQKADLNHNHIIGQVEGLQNILNNKSPVGHKHPISDIDNLTETLQRKAELTNGRILLGQLPDEVFGKVTYMGQWDFNFKSLPEASIDNKGWYFVASNHVRSVTEPSFIEGDWAVSNGTSWDKIDNSDRVLTISGRSGDVTLTTADLSDFTTVVIDPLNTKAPIESPTFLGYPKTPTAVDDDISKTIANTQFVSSAIKKATGALTPYDIGLGEVNNTSDINKPISILTQNALDNKADKIHTHVVADVIDLQIALDNKANKIHTHVINDVTGLQYALDNKANKVHTHVINDVTGLQAALDNKASKVHVHLIADVVGLQSTLDAKVDEPTYTAGLALKADKTDIVTLQTNINTKANKSGDTFTGQVVVPTLVEKALDVPTTNAIDMQLATFWNKTVAANTTFTVSNIPTASTGGVIILTLINGGSATVGWWSGIKWANGTVPALTVSGKDILGFFTTDGGVNWTGVVLSKDAK